VGGWIGYLTIEQGKVEAGQSDAHQACQILGMGGGFIRYLVGYIGELSPVG